MEHARAFNNPARLVIAKEVKDIIGFRNVQPGVRLLLRKAWRDSDRKTPRWVVWNS